MRNFENLTKEEKRKITNEWLNCEGADDAGNLYDNPKEFYEQKQKSEWKESIQPAQTGIPIDLTDLFDASY